MVPKREKKFHLGSWKHIMRWDRKTWYLEEHHLSSAIDVMWQQAEIHHTRTIYRLQGWTDCNTVDKLRRKLKKEKQNYLTNAKILKLKNPIYHYTATKTAFSKLTVTKCLWILNNDKIYLQKCQQAMKQQTYSTFHTLLCVYLVYDHNANRQHNQSRAFAIRGTHRVSKTTNVHPSVTYSKLKKGYEVYKRYHHDQLKEQKLQILKIESFS